MLMLIVSERIHFWNWAREFRSWDGTINAFITLVLGCWDFHCTLRILHPYHHQSIWWSVASQTKSSKAGEGLWSKPTGPGLFLFSYGVYRICWYMLIDYSMGNPMNRQLVMGWDRKRFWNCRKQTAPTKTNVEACSDIPICTLLLICTLHIFPIAHCMYLPRSICPSIDLCPQHFGINHWVVKIQQVLQGLHSDWKFNMVFEWISYVGFAPISSLLASWQDHIGRMAVGLQSLLFGSFASSRFDPLFGSCMGPQ